MGLFDVFHRSCIRGDRSYNFLVLGARFSGRTTLVNSLHETIELEHWGRLCKVDTSDGRRCQLYDIDSEHHWPTFYRRKLAAIIFLVDRFRPVGQHSPFASWPTLTRIVDHPLTKGIPLVIVVNRSTGKDDDEEKDKCSVMEEHELSDGDSGNWMDGRDWTVMSGDARDSSQTERILRDVVDFYERGRKERKKMNRR